MRVWGNAAFVLLFTVTAAAQQPSTAGRPAPSTTPSPGGVGAGPTTTPTNSSPFPDPSSLGQRPIFISGKVVLSDGTPLPERVKIERVCNSMPHVETYTDRKGRFSFEVGRSLEMQDASSSNSPADGIPGMRGNAPGSQFGGGPERSLWGCELRASLAGYRSDQVSLSNIHSLDNPDVGTLILHALAKVDGLTISVTSALAPKDARKAYEKGQAAASRKNPDEAQKDFEKAVELYPQYSSAWFDLGRLHEQRERFEEARTAYRQAIAAESKFIQPYERLAWLALRDSKWEELDQWTGQLLRLDPFNNPEPYYLSSVANLQLRHYDVAEKNAREALKLDPARKNARTHYVLGLVLAQEHEFAASADSLREFLMAAPEAKDADVVRQQLSQVEEAARGQAPASQP
jgi:tetratricopeptide (TPR) repeat protein